MAPDDMLEVKRPRLERLNSADQHTAASASRIRGMRPAPESQLPVELITIILKHYLSTEGIKELYGLKLVSKAWKELIEHTPWFWTYISANYPATVIQECLRLSRNHPLRIRIFSNWYNGTPKNLIQKLQLLQLHADRWEELNYNTVEGSPANDQRILDFLESPALNLQTLVAGLPEHFRERLPTLNLAGGKTNKIKHLSLQNVLLPWSSQLLTGLETFRVGVEDMVLVEDIVNVFVKSPGLRSFDLSYRSRGQNIATLPSFADPIPFHVTANSLSEVTLSFDDPRIASDLLSQMSMPACRSLKLVIKTPRAFMMNDIDWHALNVALSQFAPKIGQAIREAGSAVLYIWPNSPWEWSMSSQEEEFQFSFDFSNLPLYQFIECAHDLAMISASELELEVYLGPVSREIVDELGEWSEITKLHVDFRSSDDQGCERLSDYLGQVRMNPSPGLSWPFPNLEELDLSELECPLLKVFDMLNRRYLPDSDLQRLEDMNISISSPPELDLRVRNGLQWEDAAIVPAIESHRGVKSLEFGSLEI
ncbi:hypothetical protein FRC01_000911 [Tulasnella sp. 417]|nr:hypothetical protein FRC01_000911 [Tulasnella sp. 417]